MEQATNLFTKGLQMDTHPMVQGNDTLTDCLNGTLITMNGDEVILQNDMGNRRVDLAFLPAGYEPVGMKEYGGIIYIAAYNPITNKSQIGSFPSPLRKYIFNTPILSLINLTECDGDNGWIKTSSKLIKISDDIIHVGDKFAFSFEDSESESGILGKLSNYNNTEDGKIKSPKNLLYVFSIGVLDNYGKFYDITSRLCRYSINSNGIPNTYTHNESDLYKFNDGYFIANTLGDSSNPANTSFLSLSDLDLEEQRFMKIYGNTYSEKFIGPLYLKIEQNYMLNFTYNLEAYKTEENQSVVLKLKITGRLIYNCPDGCVNETGTNDEIYKYYKTNPYSNSAQSELNYDGVRTPNFSFFKLFATISNNINDNEHYTDENGDTKYFLRAKSTTVNVTYDKITNLYTAIVVQNYTFPAENNEKFLYDIKVMGNYNCQSTYVKEISSLNNIFDASLINSNKLILKGWKFKNNVSDKKTTIKYILEAYPSKNVKFENLTMTFINIEDPSDIHTMSGLSINNGINEETIYWDEVGLNSRKLYEVKLKYIKINRLTGDVLSPTSNYIVMNTNPVLYNYYDQHIEYDGNELIIGNVGNNVGNIGVPRRSGSNEINVSDIYANVDVDYLWILTTELLNDCYNTVDNFCDIEEEGQLIKLKNQEIKDKLKINYDIKFSNINISYVNHIQYIGNPISVNQNNNNIDYRCKHTVEFNVDGDYVINIINEELYPEFITLDCNFNGNSYVNITNFGLFEKDIIDLFKGNIPRSHFEVNNLGGESSIDSIILNNNNKFNMQITIIYYDCMKGIANTPKIVSLDKAVIPISEKLQFMFPQNKRADYATPSVQLEAGHDYEDYTLGRYVIKTSIEDRNDISNNYVDKFIVGSTGRLTATSTYDEDGLSIMNRGLKDTNYTSNVRSMLVTYLSPCAGNHINGTGVVSSYPLHQFDIKLKEGNTSIPLFIGLYSSNSIINYTSNFGIKRMFIKIKRKNSLDTEWVLVKWKQNYHISTNSNESDIPDIEEKISKYSYNGNSYNVFIYTNTQLKINVKVYYPSFIYQTNSETNIDIYIKISGIDNNNIKINSNVNDSYTRHPFINSLGIKYIDNSLKIATILDNKLEELNDRLSMFLHGQGKLAIDNNNDVFILDLDDTEFYYYDGTSFNPLKSILSLDLNYLIVPESNILNIKNNNIYDEYDIAGGDTTTFNLKYDRCIDLSNINIYSE